MAQTKQQRERILLAVLLSVAVLVWYFSFGKKVTGSALVSQSGNYMPINAEDYSLIFKDMEEAQSAEYKPSGRNIFIAAPPPVVHPAAPVAVPVEPPHINNEPQLPPPPPPPQLTMKFFGYGTLQSSGPRRAFLQDGDEVHIVQEGDTILNHIRITHIGNDRIEYEDTNTGMKNSSPLEMPPAP
jgi:hypothetical protein